MEQHAIQGVSSVAGDLRWYYARAGVGPLRSNYGAMAYQLAMGRGRGNSPPQELNDDLLEAAARSGGIARVLRAVDPETEDVLWRAFGAEVPEEYAVVGELSALAPLTQAAKEAHRRLGRRESFGEWLRHLFTRSTSAQALPTLLKIRAEARAMRGRAVAAYLAARRRVGRHG
jgi:hypothetical protein